MIADAGIDINEAQWIVIAWLVMMVLGLVATKRNKHDD